MDGTRITIFLVINAVALLQAAVLVAGGLDCDRILNYNSSVLNGQISSPRYPLPYPTNISCTWTIVSPPRTYIGLFIKKISIRSSVNCLDHVIVKYSGPSPSWICYSWDWGSGCRAYYSPDNKMIVTFTAGTGNNTGRQGFFATFSIFKAVCPKPDNLTSLSGRLMSPNYHHYYPGNLTCQWVIRVPQGYRIYLTFPTVKLQPSDLCKSDYILVMDGAGSSAYIIKRFCDERYFGFSSSGNTMTVRFVSDLLFTNRGFYARYSAIAPYASSPTPITSSTSTLAVKPTPEFLPDNLIGTYQGSYGVAVKDHSYINRLKTTSKITCVLKCQQTLECKAATFSYHGDGNNVGLCTLYVSSLRYKPDKNQQLSGDVYYEQVRFHI